ncbi:Septin-domain-containing protein [Zopfochytrium polystomum]|nr:Septin-domain-containing protein [Zopfochytrium polystomum]
MEEQTGRRISLRLIDSAGLVLPPNIHLYSRLQPTLPPAVALNNDRELESIAQRWTDPIAAAIDAQYEATLQEESKVRRNPKSPDYLHHACLYFIDGHTVLASRGLTPLDRYALKRLADKLNVLLCIGKADMLTRRQLIAVRKYVTSDLRTAGILPNIYGFENWRGNPEDEEEDDELYDRAANEELQRIMPFAIVNDEGLDPATEPDSAVDVFGLPARRDVAPGAPLGRFFPWGTVEVGNPEHCDVISLMTTLFSTHFDELRVRTRETFYERWRTSRLLTVRESIRQSSTSQGLGMNLESSVKTRRESGLQRLVRAG